MKNYIFGTGPFVIECAKKLEKHNIIVDGFLKLGNKSDISQKLYKDIPLIFLNEKCLNPETDNIFITKKPIIMGDTTVYLRRIVFITPFPTTWFGKQANGCTQTIFGIPCSIYSIISAVKNQPSPV